MPIRPLLPAILLLLATPPAWAAERLVDGIAAQVGSRIVLISEVMRQVGPQEAQMRSAGAPEQEVAKLRARVLEQLIEARLIEGVVERFELYADDEEIDATIQGIAEENGLTLEQLYASVVFHGMTRDEYRQQIKQDLERRSAVNGLVGSRIEVDESEVRALYEQRFAGQPDTSDNVHVRQILVAANEARPESAACAMARDARARVESGEPFEDVAREVSDFAPETGGDVGWIPTDELADWMSQAVSPLSPGELSQPVPLPFGCSVLQLVERRKFERVSYEQASPMLQQELWNQRIDDEYREWMEGLRENTYIDRRGYFADAAQFGEATFPVGATESATP